MMDQFVIAMQNVFQSDAVETVNPMTYEVYTPSQILGTFNAVAYQKCKNQSGAVTIKIKDTLLYYTSELAQLHKEIHNLT